MQLWKRKMRIFQHKREHRKWKIEKRILTFTSCVRITFPRAVRIEEFDRALLIRARPSVFGESNPSTPAVRDWNNYSALIATEEPDELGQQRSDVFETAKITMLNIITTTKLGVRKIKNIRTSDDSGASIARLSAGLLELEMAEADWDFVNKKSSSFSTRLIASVPLEWDLLKICGAALSNLSFSGEGFSIFVVDCDLIGLLLSGLLPSLPIFQKYI